MLICAALAAGESTLRGVSLSQDVCATIDALSALGAQVIIRDTSPAGATVCVRGIGGRPRPCGEPLCCRESGSTLRFVIPLCLLSEQGYLLRGSARLFRRPLAAYRTLFSSRWGEQVVDESCSAEGGSLEILGGDVLLGGEYQLEGDVSSQFISGLLFALPLCEKDSRIVLNSIPESRPYIDLTLDALRRFGVRAWWDGAQTLCVPGGQAYRPHDGAVEGDASGAAFFGALNAFGGEVLVTGLSPDSLQGDRVYAVHIATLMAHGQDGGEMPCIDLADCPDLAPILFTVAAEHGGATFTHTERLRTKECDRIAAMQQELAKFGARLTAEDAADSVAAAAVGGIVRVLPSELHAPCEPLDGHNDHRVVMSLAVIATKYGGVIRGSQAVAKSMPDFFDRMRALGVVIEEM
jgi:3-phosphoshikimate 1-carboxyvinyltransferase